MLILASKLHVLQTCGMVFKIAWSSNCMVLTFVTINAQKSNYKHAKDIFVRSVSKCLNCVIIGMLHYEGGWPKEIDVTDDEQKQRYCKKSEKEEGYTQTILGLCDTMETTILQNSAIDIYEEYFEGCEGLGGEDVPSGEAGGKGGGDRMLKVKSEFKDQHDRYIRARIILESESV